MKKLLVVQTAALGWDLVSRHAPPAAAGFSFRRAAAVFPALTCTAQASFRTGLQPCDHGMVLNGIFLGDVRRVMFWEQSAGLVAGRRIWDRARAAGKRVGLLFWQQSLGEHADVILSPRPIHKHHGGMIQDCYSQPPDLYDQLARRIGKPFNLMHYWGPLASWRSTDWIVQAVADVVSSPSLAPDLLLAYLPHLDYDLQRFGPESPKAVQSLEKAYGWLSHLRKTAEAAGYDWLILGDYNIEPARGAPVYPNRLLRQEDLFSVRRVQGRAYPDFFASRAFALVDHQVASVYAADEEAETRARDILARTDGVAEVLDADAQRARGIGPSRAGHLLAVAAPGRWFAYRWWSDRGEEPDYASHVDIHNKPGYDPAELFFGWPPPSTSRDDTRVRGTHGRAGEGTDIAWASSLSFDSEPQSYVDLAREIGSHL